MCGKNGHFARDCWSRAKQDRTENQVEGVKVNSDAGKELVYALENVVRDVNFSQSGSEVHNVCPKWFGESSLEISDGSVQLRGADGRKFQDYGKRKIWLQIGNHLRQ